MAANDAWELQGMNGAAKVSAGQSFAGLSRGLFCLDAGAVEFDLVNPAGGVGTVAVTPGVDGFYIPGPISSVTVTAGMYLVYPDSTDYQIA